MAKLTAILLLAITTPYIADPIITRDDLSKQAGRAEVCASMFHFNNAYYTMDEALPINGIPADMSVHWATGNIFYTLISEAMKMNVQILHASGKVDSCVGQSVCVDNLNDIIYVATDNGVYKYNEDTTKEPYAAKGEDVMYVCLSHDGSIMYIATWPQNRVHKITNGGRNLEMFPEIPNGHGLTSDPGNNLYFIASKTSYILKSGTHVPVNIAGLSKDKITGVSVCRSGEVFAMDENSNFYRVDPVTARARFLGSFNVTGVNTFAIDASDNILIGIKNRLYKFVTHDENPCISKNNIRKRHNKWYKGPQTTITPDTAEDEDYYE